MAVTIDLPAIKTNIKISPGTKKKLMNNVNEESQVIIHCSYTADSWGENIRIWKSTFLCPRESSQKSKLLYHENITLYPAWTPVALNKTIFFTLIFSALPASCKFFDLIEEIPIPGGFKVKNIKRNKSDIYEVVINNPFL